MAGVTTNSLRQGRQPDDTTNADNETTTTTYDAMDR